jgi:RHS repeat-associated protein
VQVNQNGTEAGAYTYDAMGRRVIRQVFGTGAGTDHYVFDPAGHLLADYNGATGAVLKEYVWIGDRPVAVIDSTSGQPVTYYIQTGPLNEPLELTNAAKALVWNGYVNPFGAAQTFSQAQATIDLRLPGQWTELETDGLSQNGFRDYDPGLGRYIEADPLGINAGQNLYAYVSGDPLNATDPSGLITFDQEPGSNTILDPCWSFDIGPYAGGPPDNSGGGQPDDQYPGSGPDNEQSQLLLLDNGMYATISSDNATLQLIANNAANDNYSPNSQVCLVAKNICVGNIQNNQSTLDKIKKVSQCLAIFQGCQGIVDDPTGAGFVIYPDGTVVAVIGGYAKILRRGHPF